MTAVSIEENRGLIVHLHALDAVSKGAFFYVPDAEKYEDGNFLRSAYEDNHGNVAGYCEGKDLDEIKKSYDHVKAIPRLKIKATMDDVAKPTGGCYSTDCYDPFVRLTLDAHHRLYRKILLRVLDTHPWEIAEVEYVSLLGYGVTKDGPNLLEVYGFVPWRTEYNDRFFNEQHSDYKGPALVTRDIEHRISSKHPTISFRLLPFTSIVSYKPLKSVGAGKSNAWDSLLIDLSESSDEQASLALLQVLPLF